MTKRSTLALLLAVLVGHATQCISRKDCITPIRASRRENRPTCPADFALVPKTICHNSDRTSPECQRQSSEEEGSHVCAMVVEALFAEWNMMDGAFLTSGTCHASIQEGRFSAQDALRVLPDNYELVGIQIRGSTLLRVMEKGLEDYYSHGKWDAYPHTAGFKYELDLEKGQQQRIQNLQVMGYMCNWKPFDENATYMILTDSNLASTVFDTSDILSISGTGRGCAESFFLYATSVCIVEDNWHQMRLKHHHQPAAEISLDTDGLEQ
jgi:5'-nucleotidase, C-terminal domain